MPLLDAQRQLREEEGLQAAGGRGQAEPGLPEGPDRCGGACSQAAGNFPNPRSHGASALAAPGTLAAAHKEPYFTIFEGKKAQCPSSPCG